MGHIFYCNCNRLGYVFEKNYIKVQIYGFGKNTIFDILITLIVLYDCEVWFWRIKEKIEKKSRRVTVFPLGY